MLGCLRSIVVCEGSTFHRNRLSDSQTTVRHVLHVQRLFRPLCYNPEIRTANFRMPVFSVPPAETAWQSPACPNVGSAFRLQSPSLCTTVRYVSAGHRIPWSTDRAYLSYTDPRLLRPMPSAELRG
eukprot:243268-Rhodomonas_salina.3